MICVCFIFNLTTVWIQPFVFQCFIHLYTFDKRYICIFVHSLISWFLLTSVNNSVSFSTLLTAFELSDLFHIFSFLVIP